MNDFTFIIILGLVYGTATGIMASAITNPFVPEWVRGIYCGVFVVVCMAVIGIDPFINAILRAVAKGE
jgi:hypothetical protein